MSRRSKTKCAPDTQDPEQLLTILQVAQLLQCSEQTIRNHIAEGKFPGPTNRFGKMVRWRRANVVEYLHRQQGRH